MNYLWNNNWIAPYESLWSIIEKFKYVNVYTNRNLKEIFDFMPNGQSMQSNQNLYIYRYNKFNEEKIKNIMQFDLDNHFLPLSCFSFNPISELIDPILHYCPECIRLGYHSYFHQLKYIKKCVFHDKELLTAHDHNRRVCQYVISSANNEAYKNTCDISSVHYEKYLSIPDARYLIANVYGHSSFLSPISKCNLSGIRFFNPILLNNIKSKTYSYIYDLFWDKPINQYLAQFSFKECEENYNILIKSCRIFSNECNPKRVYIPENNNFLQPDIIEEWLIINTLEDYIFSIDPEILQDVLYILYNHLYELPDKIINKSCYDEEKYKDAVTKVLLAYHISNARDVYDSTINLRKTVFGTMRRENCKIKCGYILKNRIDDNKYSIYLLYYIYERIISKTYTKINEIISKLNFSEISILLDLDIDNVPDYIICTKDNRYFIYEID